MEHKTVKKQNKPIQKEKQNEEEKLLLENIAAIKIQKKQDSKKNRERKIMEFKFRSLELLDIFCQKSKNVQHLTAQIIPLSTLIFQYQFDQSKHSFIQKLTEVLKKYFEKIQYSENLDEVCSHLLQLLFKTKNKFVQKTFQTSIQQILNLKRNQNGNTKNLQEDFNQSIIRFATHRESQYNIEFFISILKQDQCIRGILYDNLIKYSNLKEFNGAREIQRKQVMDLLLCAVRNESNDNIDNLVKNNLESISNLAKNYFNNLNNIKKKKQNDIKKYGEFFTILIKQSKHKLSIEKVIKQSLTEKEQYDQELNKIVKQQLNKFQLI